MTDNVNDGKRNFLKTTMLGAASGAVGGAVGTSCVRPRRSSWPDLGRISDRRSPSRSSSNGLTNGTDCRS
jgi:hypothetical protein